MTTSIPSQYRTGGAKPPFLPQDTHQNKPFGAKPTVLPPGHA